METIDFNEVIRDPETISVSWEDCFQVIQQI